MYFFFYPQNIKAFTPLEILSDQDFLDRQTIFN